MNRPALIDFIKLQDKSYQNVNFTQYSDAQLVLLKIKMELEKSKKNNKNSFSLV